MPNSTNSCMSVQIPLSIAPPHCKYIINALDGFNVCSVRWESMEKKNRLLSDEMLMKLGRFNTLNGKRSEIQKASCRAEGVG